MKKIFLAFAICLTSISVWGFDVEVDGINYNLVSDKKQAVVTFKDTLYSKVKSYCGSVIIPTSITCNDVTYDVTGIGDEAFYDSPDLTSVTIPNSVTWIGEKVFFKCPGLESIKIDTSNKFYDSRDNCNAIIETSSNTLVTGCNNSVIPISVTSIGDKAFYCCSKMAWVTIPNSVTSIGNYAFLGCGLNSVEIPNSVTSIGTSAFNGCSNMTSVTIGNSVTVIGERAFSECKSLTSLTIGNSVTTIMEHAFSTCSSLTSVEIPNSVTRIGDGVFNGCPELRQITIGDGIKSVGQMAFACPNIETVVCAATIVPSTCFNSFGSNLSNATLKVPNTAWESYCVCSPWNNFGKIQTIEGTGIGIVEQDAKEKKVYNLSGMKAKDSDKGLMIIDGKKYISE